MKTITLVTGNPAKLREWQRLLPAKYNLESLDVELPEIQSLDPEVIVADKAKRAFELTGKPVVVEDIAAGLDELNGLPGPFIKFFIKAMGENALYQLASEDGVAAAVTCAIGYHDGEHNFTVKVAVQGKVYSARGENGFGFDKCFVVDGQDLTYGEMSHDQKDAISHRAQAMKLFWEAFDNV